ncbi:MAG: transposase [Gemmatimonadaceae bacterium]
MYLDAVLKRFVQKSPVTVMTRACLERALEPDALNALFERHAEWQYTRTLLFSSLVDMMALVVCRIQPSVSAAYRVMKDDLAVSLACVYEKLDGVEASVSAALVQHTAERLAPVIKELGGELPPLLAGYRTRVIDGNHFASTDRRLAVLRDSKAGPLPSQALVVLDPALMLATHMIPCEDAHAQERSMLGQVLALVQPQDLWIADRNFCTLGFLHEIQQRGGFYVIRHHAGMPPVSSGDLRHIGRSDTGDVFEQEVTFKTPDGAKFTVRRIVVKLDKPTQDGAGEIAILANVPWLDAGAITIANIYLKRWTVEGVFLTMTQILDGEQPALCYPKAALFTFAVALMSYNLASAVRGALRATFGHEKVEQEVSWYYVANEVRVTHGGMDVAIDEEAWVPFQSMSVGDLAARLKEYASHVKIDAFKRAKRRPKKPATARTKHAGKTHVSTARLLTRGGYKT